MDKYMKQYFGIVSQIKLEGIDKGIILLEEIWNELPENKVEKDASYLIVRELINLYIKKGNKEKLEYWVNYIFLCDLDRIDFGERELIAGKVAYELDQIKKALEYFKISFKKCKGSYFKNPNDKYTKFYFDNI